MATRKSSFDWTRIELEYLAGENSIREIADRHEISEGAIRKRAKAEKWVRVVRRVRKVRTSIPPQPSAPVDREPVPDAAAIAERGRGLLPVAAAAMAQKGATISTSQPVVLHFLGYPFEAAGMVAAVFACLAARFWIGAAQSVRKEHRWSLDIPVSGIALAFSVAIVISQRPEPLGGLLYGAGLGMLGEGIFKLAENYLQKAGAVFGIETDKPAE